MDRQKENQFDQFVLGAPQAKPAGMHMYIPIPQINVANMSAGLEKFPPHAFSDRLTRQVLEPTPSNLTIKNNSFQKNSQNRWGTYGDLFDGPILQKMPELRDTPVRFADQMPKGYEDALGLHKNNQVYIHESQRANPLHTLDTATHELSHEITSKMKSRPLLRQDMLYDNSFKSYRASPEEFMAFRAQEARGIDNPKQ